MKLIIWLADHLLGCPTWDSNLDSTLKVDAEDFENKEHLEIMEKEKGIKMEPDADRLKTKMPLSVKRKMVCKIM